MAHMYTLTVAPHTPLFGMAITIITLICRLEPAMWLMTVDPRSTHVVVTEYSESNVLNPRGFHAEGCFQVPGLKVHFNVCVFHPDTCIDLHWLSMTLLQTIHDILVIITVQSYIRSGKSLSSCNMNRKELNLYAFGFS